MTRSAESLQRRAARRNRTMEEQRRADSHNTKSTPTSATSMRKTQKPTKRTNRSNTDRTDVTANKETRTHKNASRQTNASRTNNMKPTSTVSTRAPQQRLANNNKRQHSAAAAAATSTTTEKSLSRKRLRENSGGGAEWNKPQATPQQLAKNQELRQRLAAQDPTLMGEELERAKILVERDERKQQRKLQHLMKKQTSTQTPRSSSSSPTASNCAASNTKKEKDDKYHEITNEKLNGEKTHNSSTLPTKPTNDDVAIPQQQDDKGLDPKQTQKLKEERKADKALRKQFKKTQGGGMTPEQIERAKQLVEAKKQAKRQKTGKSPSHKQ